MPKGRPRIDDQKVLEMTATGNSLRDIATALGCTTRSVSRARKRLGISQQPHPVLTDWEMATATRVIAEGGSIAEAARTIGRTGSALYPRFPGAQWTNSQSGKHAVVLRKLGGVL